MKDLSETHNFQTSKVGRGIQGHFKKQKLVNRFHAPSCWFINMMTDNFETVGNVDDVDSIGLHWVDALEALLSKKLASNGSLSFPAVVVELFDGVIIPGIVLSSDSQKIQIPDGFTIKVNTLDITKTQTHTRCHQKNLHDSLSQTYYFYCYFSFHKTLDRWQRSYLRDITSTCSLQFISPPTSKRIFRHSLFGLTTWAL